MEQYGLGIDLGTTQTAAAVRRDGRVEVVRLGGRRAEIPSLIFVQADGELLIGDAAERRGLSEPGRLAREFKRRIGDPVPVLAGGVPFSAHALTAKLLRHVLDTVARLEGGPPAVLTVTHPANWGPYKREQLDQALRMAETGPVLLRTEPEAAALQHATARRIAAGETVAVYDLGGGTFDAAVLRREGDGFLLLGEPEGVEQLGGADFDEAVFAHVIEMLGDAPAGLDPDDPEVLAALARLRRDCVEAKEALSFDTEVMIPVALPGVHTRVRLNRSELESMIAPALEDTIAAMRRALRQARVAPEELDAVLLAGGSSRIPLVSQLLTAAFDRPVVADPHPEHSIAMGAAVSTATITGGASPFATADPAPTPERTTYPAATPDRTAETAAAETEPVEAAPTETEEITAPAETEEITAPAEPVTARVPVGSAPARPQAGPAATMVETAGPPPVAYSRGAASVSAPQPPPVTTTRAFATAPLQEPPHHQVIQPPISPGGPVHHPPPPDRGGEYGGRKRRGMILLAGVLTAAVIAGAATLAVILSRGDGGAKPQGAGPTPTASTLPYPTDTMLIRVDTGGAGRPERKSNVMLRTPGVDEPVLISGTGGDVLPEWSHDRKRIALTRNLDDGRNEIWVMDASGDNARRLLTGVTGGRAAWSKDDTKLAFMKEVDGRGQMFVAPVAGGAPKQLTFSRDLKDDPAWSPDGKEIAYWVERDGQRDVYALTVDDPNEPGRRITEGDTGPAVDPAWSPDGRLIAYTRSTGPGLSDIWAADADGGKARPLTDDPAREMDPSWAPDNSWLAFTRGPLEDPRIIIVKADGSDEVKLTPGDAREGHPCWS
ncbi:WD40 repeat protein [Pseudosporangium ferrugineum]|uniref:WD40 repeat protein n=1 Tax=Pseudosporangium ferrugineum TaxID=439699 RepID=A0A2T0SJE7_9ACTN|nr:WD40 repeat protein [Pseudosporangium ferrugineum]